MASAARLNARVRRAERQVAALHEDELVRAYRAALGGLARDIADRFTYEATHTPVEALAAAGAPQSDTPPPPPRWVPPPGPALYAAVARAGAVKKIRSVQAAILTEMQNRVAIGFDVVGAPSQALLDNLGARADEALSAAVREPVATAMANAYREGDTIVEAARAIRAAVNDVKVWQAVMLARTDLIGISNGSSLLQARALNAAAPTPIITTKKWLATNDNRTRHTHREADGQEVPIDARFSVGNSQLDYPGDPHGSDSEVINCRCTVLLLDTPTTAALRAAGPWDPTKHPRDPGGEGGGRWIPAGASAVDEGPSEKKWGEGWNDPLWADVRARYEDWGFTDGESPTESTWNRPEDPALDEMVKVAGYDALPQRMTAAEMDDLPPGWVKVYRGLDSVEQAAQFRGGDYWAGKGAFGNGTYFTTLKLEAEAYAFTDGVVIEAAIPATAFLSDYATMSDIASRTQNELLDAAMPPEIQGVTRGVERNSWRHDQLHGGKGGTRLVSDPGRTAVSRGIDGFVQADGFKQGGGSFYVMQNRGAVVVSDRYYDLDTKSWLNYDEEPSE